MATQGYFTLSGLSEYLEDLAKASNNIDADVQSILLEAGADVQLTMQRLVPVDTGNLRDHIQAIGPYQDGNFSYVEVGVIHDAAYTDKETAIYGNVIEYGSARTEAQPYIRPALASKKNIIKEILKTALAGYGL